MDNAEFLNFVADRLVHIHGESEYVDFVKRLRNIAKEQTLSQATDEFHEQALTKQQSEIDELKADNERLLDFIDTVRQCADQIWLAKDAEKEWLQTPQQSLAEHNVNVIRAMLKQKRSTPSPNIYSRDWIEKYIDHLKDQAK